MPFPAELIAAPFRMQPGLRRLEPHEAQLTPLAPGGVLEREKRAVMEAGASRLCVPGFDPSAALAAIERRARDEGHAPSHEPLETRFEEDFAVLDGSDGTLPWLCVCVPSHWAPEDKLGLDFLAVHAPVADADLLRASAGPLVRLATGGDRWERHVWTVSPSSRHDQHPHRHPRAAWPEDDDAGAFVRGCWWRVERQTLFPVGAGTRQAVFTIRVGLQPLREAFASSADRQRLAASLRSMSDAVLAYKGLAAARAPLLRWLEGSP